MRLRTRPGRSRASEGAGRARPRGARGAIERMLLVGALLALGAGTSGCFAALLVGGGAVGAGTIAYRRGELSTALDAPLRDVWSAAQDTIDSLEFDVTQRRKDAVYATLVAVTATDTRVHINLERESDTVTSLRIRVGWFGDEALSQLILDRIQERL